MRKFWLVMLVACAIAALTACSDDKDDPKKAGNPVSDYLVPATGVIGEAIEIKGTGFDNSAQIYLKSTAGVDTAVEDLAVSATKATGTIPSTLSVGVYKVVLNQKGTWELGSIRLSAPEMPILSLGLPSVIKLNDVVKINGIGFTSEMKVIMETADADKTRTELSTKLGTSGVDCTVPDGVKAGSYNLILKLNALEWSLGGPIEAAVYKRFIGFKNIGSSQIDMTKFDEIYEANKDMLAQMGVEDKETVMLYLEMAAQMSNFTIVENYVYNNDGQLTAINVDAGEGEKLSYSFTHNGNVISGVNEQYDPEYPTLKSYTMTVNDGRVESSTAIYGSSSGTDRTGSYNWAYDANGYCTGLNASASGNAFMTYVRENNNLTGVNLSTIVKYDAQGKKNNIFGADVAACIAGMSDIFNPFNTIANGLGIAGKPSAQMPSFYIDGSSGEDVDKALTYTFDNDGYATSVEWGGAGVDGMFQLFPAINSRKLEFIYE